MILSPISSVLDPVIDKHSPVKSFKVRRDTPLHLKPDTRRVMDLRVVARAEGRKETYKALRNKAVKLVFQDRRATVRKKLQKSKGLSSEAWKLAKSITTTTASELPVLEGIP